MTIENILNPGLMVYLSQNPCLEKNANKFYGALIELQKTIGCEYKKVDENDRQFDSFVGQTYFKAMTHKNDGRTVIILGKDHHGAAGQGYFDIDPDPYENKTGKGLGDLVRWGHLGDSIDSGILLIDFQRDANQLTGVTRNVEEVQELLRVLKNYSFDSNKQVFLTDSSRIYETEFGSGIRSTGIKTLGDWIQYNFNQEYSQPVKQKTEEIKKIQEPKINDVKNWSSPGGSLRSCNMW